MPITHPPQITSNVSRTADIRVAIFGWLQLASGHVVKPHDPVGDQEACTSNVKAINNVCGSPLLRCSELRGKTSPLDEASEWPPDIGISRTDNKYDSTNISGNIS
jgi:hypothetical protein